MPGPRNLFEKKVSTQLKRAKVKFKYEGRKIAYVLARHYVPDFELSTPLGSVVIECKGYFRAEDKAKLRAVKRQHPELDIRILFYQKRDRDIRWAERYGFRWAIGKIPKEWMEGL